LGHGPHQNSRHWGDEHTTHPVNQHELALDFGIQCFRVGAEFAILYSKSADGRNRIGLGRTLAFGGVGDGLRLGAVETGMFRLAGGRRG
jgi:hypothetical protein